MRVSVVIPAYNAEDCLTRAVESALAQTMCDLEVIVIDDGSRDSTAALAERLAAADPRVRLIRNGQNRGVSATRNRGFAAANGDWVAVLDGDDAYVPERLERLITLGETKGADMVADNLMFYDWAARCATGPAIPLHGRVRKIGAAEFLSNCITGQSPFDYGQLKFLFRRSFLKAHDLHYPENLRHGEDFILYMRALFASESLVMTDEPLYLYTQRIGAISRTPSQMTRTIGGLEDMRDHTIDLLAHPRVRAEPVLAMLLARRARAIRWFVSWERVYESVRARDVKQVLRFALSDWRVAPLLVWEAARRAFPGRA